MSQKETQIVTEIEEDHAGAGAGAGTDRRVWDCGSPLYDSYELASLSHLLDRHMTVFTAAPSSSSGQLTKSTEESSGKGRRLWRKKVAVRRRMGKLGGVVRAVWVAVANYRSKRVVPKLVCKKGGDDE